MYIEVRYAKESSGFGDNKAMFRLKKNGKKLSSGDFQEGLERYFGGERAAVSIPDGRTLEHVECTKQVRMYMYEFEKKLFSPDFL